MIRKIAWKNILNKPFNSALCVSLLLFGVAIISILIVMQHQLNQKFERDLKDIDLVIGAKGSPLQLVLSAVYHVDAPTGNINLEEAEKIMNSPMVKKAIPLAYGDSYQSYRILGTTTDFIEKYQAEFIEGVLFKNPMEANIGEQIANKFGLKIGDTFVGTHGEAEVGHIHENHKYKVVGIFKKTNSVLDQLILTNIESVWLVHDSNHDEEHSKSHHKDRDSNNQNHHEYHEQHSQTDDSHDHEHDEQQEHKEEQHTPYEKTEHKKEITALLLQLKTKMAVLTMPQTINENTNMQAVNPAIEVNRLIHMIGVGATTIKVIAGGIMFMACFSIFFALYSRLKEREHELALLRTVGYLPKHLFSLLLYEGIMLSVIGYLSGWVLSRAGLYLINLKAENDFNLQFELNFLSDELWLLLLTIAIGVLSALIPAWRAMRIDISEILSKK